MKQVPSYVLLGIPQGNLSCNQSLLLTPMGEACLRMDLTAIHEILDKAGYKDDEGIANEVSVYVFIFYFVLVLCTLYFPFSDLLPPELHFSHHLLILFYRDISE